MVTTSTYEMLIAPHLRTLNKYCFYLTKSKWDGEDLLQSTLLKSLLFFRNTEPYMEVKPFLLRVAKNLWIDECRKRQRRRRAQSDFSVLYYTDNDYAEVRSSIEWLAERFPTRNIDIWLLSHYFGYTMQDIADDMGCTIAAVKSILYRTRELLRNRQFVTEDRKDRKGRKERKVIHLEVERWSRAIMLDQPWDIRVEG